VGSLHRHSHQSQWTGISEVSLLLSLVQKIMRIQIMRTAQLVLSALYTSDPMFQWEGSYSKKRTFSYFGKEIHSKCLLLVRDWSSGS
jgi:hypothetical protein